MKQCKNMVWHRVILAVFTLSLIIGNLVFVMPTAFAASTAAISSATFNNAGTNTTWLAVYFSEPVCADPDCTLDLDINNFEFYDGSSDGFGSITIVDHYAGNDWALLTMNAASSANDTSDKVKVVDAYTASGMPLSDTSAGSGTHTAWVSLTTDTTAPTVLTATSYVEKTDGDKDKVLVHFSEPVADENGAPLVNADFTYNNDGAGGATAFGLAAVHTTDQRWIVFDTDNNLIAGDFTDAADDSIDINDNKVYDLSGNEYGTVGTDVEFSSFTDKNNDPPAISYAYGQLGNDTSGGNDMVLVGFDEPVFSATDGSGNLAAADFAYGGAETVSSVLHTAGDTVARLDLSANLTAFSTVDGQGGSDDIFNAFGYGLTAGSPVTVDDNSYPIIRSVWVNQFIDHADINCTAVGGGTCSVEQITTEIAPTTAQEGGTMLKWTDGALIAGTDGFTKDIGEIIYDTTNVVPEYTQVKFYIYYEDDDAGVALTDNDDIAFTVSDGVNSANWYITDDITEKTWTEVTMDLTAAVDSGTALASQSNPTAWGITCTGTTQFANSDAIYIDNVRFSRGASSESNQIIIEYSESIDATGDPAEGSAASSTSTFGDMTTNRTIASLGAFASGTFTTKTGTNSVVKSTDGKRITIRLADGAGGLITQASPVTLTGLFTPTTDIEDIHGNSIEAASTHTPETIIDALDLATAASAVTDFVILSRSSQTLGLSWDSPSQTAATFSHYVVVYGTSSGVSVASSLFDESNDATLATSTTESVNLTGLTDGTTYYVNLAGVDTKGNATSLATEMSSTPAGGSGSGGDSTGSGPAAPSSFEATVDENMHVVLTWVDPDNVDLESIQIIRSFGEGVEPSSVLDSVNPDVETYTDTDVSEGDIVNYQLRGKDEDGAYGTVTETLTITVETGAATSVEDVVEEETAEEGTAAEEEEGAALEGAELPEGEGFTDTDKHWAETEILEMAGIGVAKGYPDGSFGPDNKLNRAETAAFLYRILGFDEPTAPVTAPFPDVSVDAWYAGYISDMKELEMIHGYGDGLYRPGNNITRAEFIKIALEVYYYVTTNEDIRAQIDAWMEGKKTTAYSDLEDDWYTPYVTTAANMGFIHGYECGTSRCFGAENEITRAEAIVILYNMFYNHFIASIIEEII